MAFWITGALTIDPTFLTTAATYGAAAAVWLCAAILRRGDAGDPARSYGPVSRWSESGGRVDPRPYRELDLVGSFWIIGIYAWLSLSQIAAAAIADDEKPRVIALSDLWVSIGFQGFMAAMAILIISRRLPVGRWLGIRWPGWQMLLALTPISVVAMWILFALLEGAGYMRWLESMGIATEQDTVRALRNTSDPRLIALMGFAAVVVAPLCEEIVFRGYLYGVAKRFCGGFAAALGSALVFAAAHASLVALLPLALFGLLLAWLYERTGSIWAPIIAHACFNAATVVVQLTIQS